MFVVRIKMTGNQNVIRGAPFLVEQEVQLLCRRCDGSYFPLSNGMIQDLLCSNLAHFVGGSSMEEKFRKWEVMRVASIR